MFILGLYVVFYLVFTGFVLSLYLECTGSVGVCTGFVLGLYWFVLDFFYWVCNDFRLDSC